MLKFKNTFLTEYFYKCSNDELENDVDCVVLAKKYADITTKLIFDKNTVNTIFIYKLIYDLFIIINLNNFKVSNYSKRICCISHYLKGTFLFY